MKVRWFAVSSISLVALGALVVGCSSEEDGGDDELEFIYCGPASTCPPDVSGADLDTPVSFRSDVYEPILLTSCVGNGCHDRFSETQYGWHFGDANDPLSDEEIGSVIAALQGVDSKTAGIKNVVAGDWQNSFLMMKVDGCQNESGLTCDPDSSNLISSVCEEECGDGMPQRDGSGSNPNSYPLTEDERNTIRAWIAQGAQDN